MCLTCRWSALILAAVLVTFPALAVGNMPPFCVMLQVPPANCEAGKALPCTGACPGNFSNNPYPAWQDYWKRCQPPVSMDFTLAQKQFMCDMPGAHELHVLYYTPTLSYLCCVKNPFSDGKGDKNIPATGNQKQGQ